MGFYSILRSFSMKSDPFSSSWSIEMDYFIYNETSVNLFILGDLGDYFPSRYDKAFELELFTKTFFLTTFGITFYFHSFHGLNSAYFLIDNYFFKISRLTSKKSKLSLNTLFPRRQVLKPIWAKKYLI